MLEPTEGSGTAAGPATRALVLVLGLVFLLALGLRLFVVDDMPGRSLFEPDALEYAAAAHAIADTGDLRLQFGDHRVRARYAPGWPLLLACCVGLGLRGEDLVDVNAWIGALSAVMIAALAALLVHVAWPRAPRVTVPIAALLAGAGEMLSPISLDCSRSVMSDSSAALLGNAALLLLGMALTAAPRHALLLALGGVCAGAAVAVRTPSAALLALPMAVLAIAAVFRHGRREALRRMTLAGSGTLLVVVGIGWLLMRSGEMPWQWTAYRFWVGATHDDLGKVFNLTWALRGSDPSLPAHLVIGVDQMLGLQPRSEWCTSTGLGLYWPAFAWVAAIAVYVAARQAAPATRRAVVRLLALAFVLWAVSHLVFYALYYFPAQRFYLAPLTLLLAFTGALLARMFVAQRAGWRWLALVLVTGIGVSLAHGARPILTPTGPSPDPENAEVRLQFEHWLARQPAERAEDPLPFDPIRAQALGLLTRDVLRRVASFGLLPPIRPRATLVDHGVIPELSPDPAMHGRPSASSFFPRGALAPGFRRVRWDATASAYTLALEDVEGRKLAAYRVGVGGTGPSIVEQTTGAIHDLSGLLGTADLRVVRHARNRYRCSVTIELELTPTPQEPAPSPRRWTLVLALRGRSLEIHVSGHGPARLQSADLAAATGGRAIRMPFLDLLGATLAVLPNGACVARWFDWHASRGHGEPPHPGVGGVPVVPAYGDAEPIAEVVWLTASHRLEDCLPVWDRPGAPWQPSRGLAGIASDATGDQAAGRAWQHKAHSFGLVDLEIDAGQPVWSLGSVLASAPAGETIADSLARHDPLRQDVLVLADDASAPPLPDFACRELAGRADALLGPPLSSRGDEVRLARCVSLGIAPRFSPEASTDWATVLRAYHLTAGLIAERSVSPCRAVRYAADDGAELELGAALARGVDLLRPRVVIEHASGLTIRVNHGERPWRTRLFGIEVELPVNGFCAESASGLIVLSGSDHTTGAAIAFARNPGRSWLADPGGRPAAAENPWWQRLPADLPRQALARGELVVGDDLAGLTTIAGRRGTQTVPRQPVAASALEIVGPPNLSVGRRREALRAYAVVAGQRADVTARARWSSQGPAIVVSAPGTVEARAPGATTVVAELGELRATHALTVRVLPLVLENEPRATSPRRALISLACDEPVTAVELWRPLGSTRWRIAETLPDPSGRSFVVVLSLEPSTSYELMAALSRADGSTTLSPPIVVRAPR